MHSQTCTVSIVNLLKSDTFINTHYKVVIMLLSGFSAAVDATILWQCVSKWSETKQTHLNHNCDDDDKDDEKAMDPNSVSVSDGKEHSAKYHKWMLIRKHFPFYRLPIDVICNEVLPINILSAEMAMEVLSHNCNGYQRILAQYCTPHKPKSVYPPPSSVDQFFHLNLEKYNIKSEKGQLMIQSTERTMLYSNSAMKCGRRYQWTVSIVSVSSNPWNGFGIDLCPNHESKSDDSYPGHRKCHSYGLYLDKNSFWLYANGKQVESINKGSGDCNCGGNVKDAFTFTFTYDGIQGTLHVFASETQQYTFTDIDVNQVYYPSFKTHPNIVWKICHVERPFV